MAGCMLLRIADFIVDFCTLHPHGKPEAARYTKQSRARAKRGKAHANKGIGV